MIGFDDLSLYNDSYVYNSRSSESDYAVAPHAEGNFPYWEDRKKVPKEAVQKLSTAFDALQSECKPDRNSQLRRSLMKVLKNARPRSTLSTIYSPRVEEEDADCDLDESEHFSISTDLCQTALHRVNISVTTCEDQPLYRPPSDSSSVFTTHSMRSNRSTFTARDDKSRISLDQFLEERKNESNSIITGPIALGDIAANDSASVGSAFLDVTFDDNYPQLVLTPSHDGTASRMTGSSTANSNGTLGASYPHPAAASIRSVSSFETAKKSVTSFDTDKENTSCTPRWLNDNIDRVWNQIEQGKTDCGGHDGTNNNTDENKDGALLDDNDGDLTGGKEGNMNVDIDGCTLEDTVDYSDEDTVDGSYESVLDDPDEKEKAVAETPVQPRKHRGYLSDDSFDWIDSIWSFSADDGARSISNLIENEVIHPILKPICQLVEATEIPATGLCGAKSRRPPLNEKTLNTSSYRMSPRKTQTRVTV